MSDEELRRDIAHGVSFVGMDIADTLVRVTALLKRYWNVPLRQMDVSVVLSRQPDVLRPH